MAVHLTRTTVKGFKLCCISTALEGTDDMLWNDCEEDGDVEEAEGSDCEGGDSDTDW